MEELTIQERQNLIRELACWYTELKDDLSDMKFHDWASDKMHMSDEELVNWWFDCVGEWVMERNDMHQYYEEGEEEEWLNTQFEAVKAGEPRKYGFVVSVSLPEPEAKN